MADRLPLIGIQRTRRKSRAQIAMIDALIRTPVHSLNSRFRTVSFSSNRLFLVGLGLSLLTETLLLLAEIPLLGSGITKLAVSTTLDRAGLLAGLDLVDTINDGGGESRCNGRDSLGVLNGVLAVTSLGLTALAGEDDEALLVGLEAGNVEGQGLLAEVLAASVDGNTDGGSVKLGDTGSLLQKKNLSVTITNGDPCRGAVILHSQFSPCENFVPSTQPV